MPATDRLNLPPLMRRAGRLAAVICALLPAVSPGAGDLSEAEARGKRIYVTGQSQSGRVIRFEDQSSSTPASASILPCVQCHGEDGRGIDGLGPNVNWDALTIGTGHEHLLRRHAPFDESSFARAVTEGVDPAGNALQATMPRYTMAAADMADLVAYLKRIGSELDPGLTPTSIRIGTALPTEGPLAGVGIAMQKVLQAYFADVNTAGGIHGRRLELVVGRYGSADTPAFWEVQDLVDNEPVFALLATYLPGYEQEMSTLVKAKKLPHIGPNSLMTGTEGGPYEFFIQPSIVEQTDALIGSLVGDGDPARVAILYPLVRGIDSLAESARARARAMGLGAAVSAAYALHAFDAKEQVGRLREGRFDAIVFLGTGAALSDFARAADAEGWHPRLLAPAIFAERSVFELPAAFDGRVFLAYPSLPSDQTDEGVAAFETLHYVHGIDYDNSLAQVAAFSAARVLAEGLERAGRDLSRGGLVEALEGLRDFSPGLTPAVSFGADRRIGVQGAHVVRVGLANQELNDGQRWISTSADAGERR